MTNDNFLSNVYIYVFVSFVLWLSGWNVLIVEHKTKAISLNEWLWSISVKKNVDLIRFETEILFRIDKENVVTAVNIVRVWMWARARAQGLGHIFVHWIGLAAEQRNALNKITSNQSIAMVHSYTWGRNFSTDQCTHSNQSLAGLWAAALLLPLSFPQSESNPKINVMY